MVNKAFYIKKKKEDWGRGTQGPAGNQSFVEFCLPNIYTFQVILYIRAAITKHFAFIAM